jgi:photosystem II stability/assembly factor-like uncharacterized protein
LPVRCSKGLPVFLNSATGWIPGSCDAGGGPYFFVTHDAGRTWNDAAISLPAAYSASCLCGISSLRFADSRNGVFVLDIYGADGQPHTYVYATHDGGASWRPGPTLPLNCYAIAFVTPTNGWTIDAKSNNILQTNDGGQHWSLVGTIPSSQVVEALQFVTRTVGWAMGSEPTGNTLIKTSDGGQTWTTQVSP